MSGRNWTSVSFAFVLPSLVLSGSFLVGCAGSRRAATDDATFFEPVKSIEQPPLPESAPVVKSKSQPSLRARADSLVTVQENQGQRIKALVDKVQLLGAARHSDKPDSSKEISNPPTPALKPAAPVGRVARLSYSDVLRSYNAGDYQKAVNGFQDILKRGTPQNVEDDFYLFIGVSQFHLGQFAEAIESLQRVVRAPSSKKKADAYYVLGLTQSRLGDYREAKSMFEAVLNQNPGDELAASARRKLSALQLAR